MQKNPNVGPDPVAAEPNHDREKTYEAPDVPVGYGKDLEDLPEKTAEETVREELPDVVDGVKAKL